VCASSAAIAHDLVRFVAFASDDDRVARDCLRERRTDGAAPVEHDAGTRLTGNRERDRARIFRARIVGRDDDAIG
jgi:hypothetical protein